MLIDAYLHCGQPELNCNSAAAECCCSSAWRQYSQDCCQTPRGAARHCTASSLRRGSASSSRHSLDRCLAWARHSQAWRQCLAGYSPSHRRSAAVVRTWLVVPWMRSVSASDSSRVLQWAVSNHDIIIIFKIMCLLLINCSCFNLRLSFFVRGCGSTSGLFGTACDT